MTYTNEIMNHSTLPLVNLNSEEGIRRLRRQSFRSPVWSLLQNLEPQVGATFCSIATTVTLLNSMHTKGLLTAPAWISFSPTYTRFSQFTLLNYCNRCAVTYASVALHGATLSEWWAFTSEFVSVNMKVASKADVKTFRSDLRHLSSNFIGVNYDRRALGQQGEGHVSPVAAFDEQTDSVLVLDVAMYRYDPVWVQTTNLFAAMTSVDPTSAMSRGWLTLEPRNSASILTLPQPVLVDFVDVVDCIHNRDGRDGFGIAQCSMSSVSSLASEELDPLYLGRGFEIAIMFTITLMFIKYGRMLTAYHDIL